MIKFFRDIAWDDIATCWGKWASLGELMRAWFPFSDWFVLTTEAFWKGANDRADQVINSFDQLNTQFVAVRSSATKEDWIDDSFAGQFDTYLFVNRENLIEKILECHDSINSNRIKAYCESKSIDIHDIKVAVVIQKMVSSEVAWVAFTVNPITNNQDQVMIEWWFWIGEAVVSWMVTPDNYLRSKKDNKILDKQLSSQKKMLLLDEKKGWIIEIDVKPSHYEDQKLSDEYIILLAKICEKIEEHYKKPMDIERALEKWNLFILQARPITTLVDSTESVFEQSLLNERRKEWFWLADNQLKMLSWIDSEINIIKLKKFLESGDRDIQRFNANPVFLNPTWMWNNIIFEEYFGIWYEWFFFNHKWSQREMWYNHNDFYRLRNLMEDMWYSPWFLNKVYEEYISSYEKCFPIFDEIKTLTTNNSDDDFLRLLKQVNRAQCYSVWVAHSTELLNFAISVIEYDSIVSEIWKERFSEIEKDIFVPDTLSFLTQEHNELFIVASIQNNSLRSEKLEQHVQKWHWIHNSYIWDAWLSSKDFISRFSYVLKEGLIEHDIVKRDKLIESLNLSVKTKKLIEIANFTTAWHDKRKANIISSIHYFHHILKLISKKYSIDMSLLLYLSFSDIENIASILDLTDMVPILTNRSNDVIYMILDHKEFIFTWELYNDFNRKIDNLATTKMSDSLTWKIANKGKVRWVVRVCTNIESIHKFQAWEILVASMTQPEYMPAITKASAIITDEWGITCHAAIVSRELWVPCVIWTKSATLLLKDWDKVEVDAYLGVIKKLTI